MGESPTAQVNGSPRIPTHVFDCVVKVYCTHTEPDYEMPWSKRAPGDGSASGFLISKRRILTNAHAVTHPTSLLVEKRGSDEKFEAVVLAISHDADLALLSVDDERFWHYPSAEESDNYAGIASNGELHSTDRSNTVKGEDEGVAEEYESTKVPMPFLRFSAEELPNLHNELIVLGYPVGGENLSITSGIVSRILMHSYEHGNVSLVAIQTDAAINDGNSGGPAVNRNSEVIGVSFESYRGEGELLGYCIPNIVVAQFLSDYEKNGRCTGIACCGFEWQNLENESLRRALKLPRPEKSRGVLVKTVHPTSDAHRVLRRGDIVTAVDGVAISDQGSIPFMRGDRINFDYLITQKRVNESISLDIVRDGKEFSVSFKVVSLTKIKLVPERDDRDNPKYLIVGGLLFTPLTIPLVHAVYYGVAGLPTRIREQIEHGKKMSNDHEVVVMRCFLKDKVNLGYQHLDSGGTTIVRGLNGKKILNLKHLADILAGCTSEFLEFDLVDDETVVMNHAEAMAANIEILKRHAISSASCLD